MIKLGSTHVILFLIITLAACLRIYKLDSQGIWFDEKASIGTAVGVSYGYYECKGIASWNDFHLNNKPDSTFTSKDFWKFNTFKNTYNACILNNGSIVYFFTLYFWIKAFNTSDFAVRSLSVLFGLLTVILSFFISYSLFNTKRLALITSFLFAIHPLLIDSSQFARSGAMTTFLTLLSTFLFIKIIQGSSKRLDYFGYAVTCSFALLSHYLAIYIFLGHGLIMLTMVRDKIIWKKFILSVIAAMSIFSIWMFSGGFEGLLFLGKVNNLFVQLINKMNLKEGTNLYFSHVTFKNIIIASVQNISTIFGNFSQILYFNLRILLCLFTIPICFIIISFNQYKINRRDNKLLTAFLILSFSASLYSVIAAISSKHMVSFNIIYSQYSVPYAILLLAFGINSIWSLPEKLKPIVPLLASIQVILMIVSVMKYYNPPNSRLFNPYMTLANKIKTVYQPNNIVVFPSWGDAQLTNLYLKYNNEIIQRVDTTLTDRVLLINNNSQKSMEIYNFNTNSLRY